jgi:hypothetical protein
MATKDEEINDAALDFIKAQAMESGITLTESDIKMIMWGILAGSWATYKRLNDDEAARRGVLKRER